MLNWTVEEARAYLPRLRLLLGVIRRAAHLAVSARGNGHATLPGAPSPAGTDPHGTAASSAWRATPDADGDEDAEPEPPVAFDAEEALQELEEHGIVLRDPDRGLVDFPCVHRGRPVLLCWQLGEDDLAWWHFPEDGFAGRRPLPLPPEL